MARSPKSVSIRHLHAAVKSALEATKKEHLSVKIASDPGRGIVRLIYFRYPWFAGIPPFPSAISF